MIIPFDETKIPKTDILKTNYTDFSLSAKWLLEGELYDGMVVEGVVVKPNGEKYWALWVDECDLKDTKYYRTYVLFDIGKDRIEYETYWIELFELCLENYCSCGLPGKFFKGRFKKDYKEICLTDYPIVGWMNY